MRARGSDRTNTYGYIFTDKCGMYWKWNGSGGGTGSFHRSGRMAHVLVICGRGMCFFYAKSGMDSWDVTHRYLH